MGQTLQQLGQLLLGAIPTAVLLLFLYGCYSVLVAGPLEKALQERYAKTEGAFEQAKQDIAAADARAQEYEDRIREARVAIFKALEGRRQQAMQARAAAAAEARAAADSRIRAAKSDIEQQMLAARAGLKDEAERLAGEIINAIVTRAAAAPNPAGGAR